MSAASPEFQEWAERADRYAAPGSADRVYTDIILGRVRVAQDRQAEGIALLQGALQAARRLDDQELLLTAVWQSLRNLVSPRHWRDAAALAEEFVHGRRDGVAGRTQGQLLEFCGAALLFNGNREGAEQAFDALGRLTGNGGHGNDLQALSFEGVMAVLDGRLDDAVALGNGLIEHAEFVGLPRLGVVALRGKGRALMYRGVLQDVDVSGLPNTWRPVFLAHAHRDAEARESLARVHATFLTAGAVDPLAYSPDLATLLEAAVILGDRPVAGQIAPLLADSPGAIAVNPTVCVQRLVADAYVLLGRPDQAYVHFRQAIDACIQMRFRPELALSRLGLAELLMGSIRTDALPTGEEAPEHTSALTYLDLAIEDLRAMQMTPALARALALRGDDPEGPVSASRPVRPAGLSERELEVLCLVAQGRSSRGIARELVLSVRTVERHISNIYVKLGVQTRVQATAFALKHGLGPTD